jgi:hypothetical protein
LKKYNKVRKSIPAGTGRIIHYTGRVNSENRDVSVTERTRHSIMDAGLSLWDVIMLRGVMVAGFRRQMHTTTINGFAKRTFLTKFFVL